MLLKINKIQYTNRKKLKTFCIKIRSPPSLELAIKMAHGPDTQRLLTIINNLGLENTLSVEMLNITSLPSLPSTIKYLYCNNTKITKLPPLPPMLKMLDVEHTELVELPPLPTQLEKLNCNNTKITELPPLPTHLEELYCCYTKITELPPLPTSLRTLFISGMRITKLPPLPPNLISFVCFSTQITELPPLPASLEKLNCPEQVSEIPPLPASLKYLNCEYNNKITSLPKLPNGLKLLIINQLQITDLPPLPTSLTKLYNYNCPLAIKREEGESIADYEARWVPYREEKARRLRCQERCRVIKEDLIAEVMHPRRIQKLLDQGGFDALECF